MRDWSAARAGGGFGEMDSFLLGALFLFSAASAPREDVGVGIRTYRSIYGPRTSGFGFAVHYGTLL